MWEDGPPAVGVQWKLRGWVAGQDRAIRWGIPKDWVSPSGETDAQGRFVVEFSPPGAYQFVFEARTPGFAVAKWRWGEIRPGTRKDLGRVVLVRAGSILVRIVGKDGGTLSDGWSVSASSATGNDLRSGREGEYRHVHAPNVDGLFQIVDMPPGFTSLSGRNRVAHSVDGPTVEVVAGETVKAEILYTGPALDRRITVVTFSDPFYVVDPSPDSIHLYGPDGIERVATKIPRSSQSHAVDDLPPGEYRVEIQDPRFLPWSLGSVRPGSAVTAHVRGSASLQIHVLDASTKEAADSWTANLRFENVSFSPREFPVVEGEPPENGLVTGIIPGDFTLIVNAEDYGQSTVPIDGLGAGETREVEVLMGSPCAIHGVLRYAGGGPIPFTEVKLLRFHAEPLSSQENGTATVAQFHRQWQREELSLSTTTNDRGEFAFEGIGAGQYDLSARISNLLKAELLQVIIKDGEARSVTLSTVAEPTFVSGHCHVPAGVSIHGMKIEIQPVGVGFPLATLQSAVDSEGHYRIGPAQPGEYFIRLRFPDIVRSTNGGSSATQGPKRELDVVQLEPGENPNRDFDLSQSLPGSLHITVTNADDSSANLQVRSFRIPARGEQAFFVPGEVHATESAAGTLNSKGQVTLAPLVPGDHLIVVELLDSTALAPRTAVIGSGEQTSLTFDVTTARGSLVLRNAETQEPLLNHPIALSPRPTMPGLNLMAQFTLKTDESGRLSASLVPGTYSLSDGSNPFAAFFAAQINVDIDWSSTGPSVSEVAIPSAESSGIPNPFAELPEDE